MIIEPGRGNVTGASELLFTAGSPPTDRRFLALELGALSYGVLLSFVT